MKLMNLSAICLSLVIATRLRAGDDWPQFRGEGLGVVSANTLAAAPRIDWKTAVAGAGWSQPIVIGETVFITTAVSDPPIRPKNMMQGVADPRSMPRSKASPPDLKIQWKVDALDLATGELKWSTVVAEGKPRFPIHPSNTYATETPAADADAVYAFFGATGTVVALDHAGTLLWQRELGAHPTDENFGTGSSPVLLADKLFVQCFYQDQAFIVCLNTKTGEEQWRVNRDKAGSSWSTPFVWRNVQRKEIIVSGQKLMTSHDPESGRELWRIAGMDVPATSSVTGNEEAIFFGYRAPFTAGPLYALEAGGAGDLSPSASDKKLKQQRWAKASAAPGMPTPVVAGDYLYVLNNSLLSCHDVRDGELKYKQRLPNAATISASLVATRNAIIAVDENGRVMFVQIGPEFALIDSVELNDTVWASPAITADRLLVRGIDYLYCLRP